MKKLSFIIFTTLLIIINNRGIAQVIPQDEFDALVALYNATDGVNWNDTTGWNLAAGRENVTNHWHGITLKDGHIDLIDLRSNNLSGTIPPEIGNFSRARVLYLQGNNLTGSIPDAIGSMTNLLHFYAYNNDLNGNIPSSIGNTSLTRLLLYGNRLEGPIPSSIGNLSGLTRLYLGDNLLTGGIPPELGNLAQLTILYLQSNQLTGGIPPEIGNLTNLLELKIYNNQLTEGIPTELGSLLQLEEFYAYGNQLSGDIPPSLGNLVNLQDVRLYRNQLTGAIPDNFANFTNLAHLIVYENKISGLPHFSALPNLDLQVHNNALDFADIIPNLTVTSFSYSNQDSIGERQEFQVVLGESQTISVTVGGDGNTYQWYKDGAEIGGATASSLTINDFEESYAGRYHCQIDNEDPRISFSLYSRIITLSLKEISQDPINITLPEDSNGSITGLGSGTIVSSNGSFNFIPENLPATGFMTVENPDGSTSNIQFNVDENGNISNVQIETEGQYIPMYQDFFTSSQGQLNIVHIEDFCIYQK